MRSWLQRPRAVLLTCGAVVWVLGCTPAGDQRRRQVESVTAALEAFLPRLAETYASGDPELLTGLAAPAEIAAVEQRLAELAAQGRSLEVTLRDLTVERLTLISHSTAQVTTVETWDVRLFAGGSGEPLEEELGQRNRVRYQLKRTPDGWLVVSRTI